MGPKCVTVMCMINTVSQYPSMYSRISLQVPFLAGSKLLDFSYPLEDVDGHTRTLLD